MSKANVLAFGVGFAVVIVVAAILGTGCYSLGYQRGRLVAYEPVANQGITLREAETIPVPNTTATARMATIQARDTVWAARTQTLAALTGTPTPTVTQTATPQPTLGPYEVFVTVPPEIARAIANESLKFIFYDGQWATWEEAEKDWLVRCGNIQELGFPITRRHVTEGWSWVAFQNEILATQDERHLGVISTNGVWESYKGYFP